MSIQQQRTSTPGSILVVDDSRDNLWVLADLLARHGYSVQPAISGPIALAAVRQAPPDLILLDIMMPDMDGYTVCRLLKADAATRDIPVIFITALDGVADKVRAFAEGAADYLSKPFQPAEVLARVRTQLELQQARRLLQNQVADLERFARTVAHDLKNPLTVIDGYADVLLDMFDDLPAEDRREILGKLRQHAQKATKIVDAILLLAQVEQVSIATKPLGMAVIVAEARHRLDHIARQCGAQFELPPSWPVARGYGPWVEEVWFNYLSNGLKYGGTPPQLALGADRQSDGMLRFWVRDNGHGLSEAEQGRLFMEFTRLNLSQGYGLGLAIVQRIVARLGGRAGVESVPGQGSTFFFTLPAAE